MKRAGAGLLAIALVAAVAIVPTTTAGAEGGAAGTCLWKKHTKRVAKKVKRHGKARRVKRTKRWWTCEPVPTTAPAPPTPTIPAPAPPPSEDETGPRLERLGVKAKEWSYTLSRSEVPAGELIVELQNQGEDPHNLNLEQEGSSAEDPFAIPVTGSLEQKSARFTIPAGTYRLWCDLPEHDAKGMHATLVVD